MFLIQNFTNYVRFKDIDAIRGSVSPAKGSRAWLRAKRRSRRQKSNLRKRRKKIIQRRMPLVDPMSYSPEIDPDETDPEKVSRFELNCRGNFEIDFAFLNAPLPIRKHNLRNRRHGESRIASFLFC